MGSGRRALGWCRRGKHAEAGQQYYSMGAHRVASGVAAPAGDFAADAISLGTEVYRHGNIGRVGAQV